MPESNPPITGSAPRSGPAPTANQYRVELGADFTPATAKQMEQLRAIEQERKKWDKSYIDAETAHSIPQEVVDASPDLAHRIRNSQVDWPENRASATEALGPLVGGEGQTIEVRKVNTEDLFQTHGAQGPGPGAEGEGTD
ncbi:MAG: hypothetical protein V3S55_15950 [Nitrospiraceae bacterium]